MSELLRHETKGRDYDIEVAVEGRDHRVVVMAPHGGEIEPYTDDLAREIAGSEFRFYAFRGIKPRGNFRQLHVTSTNFDEPTILQLVERAQVALAVHGKSGKDAFAMVGGLYNELVNQVRTLLDGFGIQTRDPSASVAGQSPQNICNRCELGGVQLELSKSLRDQFRDDPNLRDQVVSKIRRLLRNSMT